MRVLVISAVASVLVGAVLVSLIFAVRGQRDAARSAFRSQEALAAEASGPAVIVTSSSDDPLYPDRARRTGARGFVAKHDLSGAALQRVLDEAGSAA